MAIWKEWKEEAPDEKGGLIDEAGALLQRFRDELGGTTAAMLREAMDVEIILPQIWSAEHVNAWFTKHNIADADIVRQLETHQDQHPWRIICRNGILTGGLRARLRSRVTDPPIEWRNPLAAELAGKEKPAAVVDIVADVEPSAELQTEPKAESKTEHSALLPSPVEKPRRTPTTEMDEMGQDCMSVLGTIKFELTQRIQKIPETRRSWKRYEKMKEVASKLEEIFHQIHLPPLPHTSVPLPSLFTAGTKRKRIDRIQEILQMLADLPQVDASSHQALKDIVNQLKELPL